MKISVRVRALLLLLLAPRVFASTIVVEGGVPSLDEAGTQHVVAYALRLTAPHELHALEIRTRFDPSTVSELRVDATLPSDRVRALPPLQTQSATLVAFLLARQAVAAGEAPTLDLGTVHVTTVEPGVPPVFMARAITRAGNVSDLPVVLPEGDGVEEAPDLAQLLIVSPNPVRGRLQLRYQVARAGQVNLAIYDVTGRRVRTLVQAFEEGGVHEKHWDLLDDERRRVSSGLYFSRLQTSSASACEKLVLVDR
jgi:hypothetical protein